MAPELLMKIVVDLSLTTTLLILAYLSRKMGQALKIPPYYVVFYGAAILVVSASGIDAGMHALSLPAPIMTNIMRGCAGIVSFGVCLKYWGWLFTEFFGAENKGEVEKRR